MQPDYAYPRSVRLDARAWIDPQAAARPIATGSSAGEGVLPDAIVKGIEEQLSGACTTEIAAFDEFTALLTDAALTADYDHIILTAPTGHTIRLLQLPGAWADRRPAKGDDLCLGPLAGLEKQRSQYQGGSQRWPTHRVPF